MAFAIVAGFLTGWALGTLAFAAWHFFAVALRDRRAMEAIVMFCVALGLTIAVVAVPAAALRV